MTERNVWYLHYRAKINNYMGEIFPSYHGPMVVIGQEYDKKENRTTLELVKYDG
jgi:hypothetical protein